MDSKIVALYGAIILSAAAMVAFFGTLIVSFLMKDAGLLNLVVGAAIANATTVVNYWLGSSSGSQRKDDALAAAAKASPP